MIQMWEYIDIVIYNTKEKKMKTWKNIDSHVGETFGNTSILIVLIADGRGSGGGCGHNDAVVPQRQ